MPAEYTATSGSAWLPQGSAMVPLEFCWAVPCQPAVCPVVQDLRVQAEENGQHMAGLAGNGVAGACTPLALHPAEGGHHSHIAAALEAQQHSLGQLQRLQELLSEELAALGEAARILFLLTSFATCSRCRVHAAAGHYKWSCTTLSSTARLRLQAAGRSSAERPCYAAGAHEAALVQQVTAAMQAADAAQAQSQQHEASAATPHGCQSTANKGGPASRHRLGKENSPGLHLVPPTPAAMQPLQAAAASIAAKGRLSQSAQHETARPGELCPASCTS